MTLAIDFGTSNTVVARWNPVTQQAETVALPDLSWSVRPNPPLVPSLLYVEDAVAAKVWAGQQVRDRGLEQGNTPRLFRSFKRGIGAQGFLPELDGRVLGFEQVGEWFLGRVLQGIRQVPLPLEDVVLTVPVDSFEPYRHWLGQVVGQWQVNQVRILDEPTAAALGYGLGAADLVLVIDFGGGTLDLSLVRLSRSGGAMPLGFVLKWGQKNFAAQSGQRLSVARVMAKAGQNLGGLDIDHWIAEDLAQSEGLALTPLLVRVAERLKIQLSLQGRAEEVYFDEDNFESRTLELSRDRLDQILRSQRLLEQMDGLLDQVLQQARRQGITVQDLDGVLLVGGTSQLPAVQAWAKQRFAPEKVRCDRPFEAIAHGALQVVQGVEIQDFLYHRYGVRYWNSRSQRHDWHSLIPAGQSYPMQEPVELILGASVENQPSIELILGELGDESTAMEVFFDGSRLVTRSVQQLLGTANVKALNDRDGARSLAQLTPPGSPGIDRIKVQFWVDRDRFLRITVEDLLTLETLVEDQVVVQLA